LLKGVETGDSRIYTNNLLLKNDPATYAYLTGQYNWPIRVDCLNEINGEKNM